MKQLIAIFLAAVMLVSLTGCSQSTLESSVPQTQPLAESTGAVSGGGVFTGNAPAFHGTLEVIVDVGQDGAISSVTVSQHNETEGYGTVAAEKIPQRIVEAQSLDIDAVAGATVTSRAIVDAAADALTQGGLNPEDFGYQAVEKKTVEISAFDADTLPEKAPVTESITIQDVKGREVTIDLPISRYAVSTMDVVDFVIPLLGEEAFSRLVGSGQDGGGGLQTYAQVYVPIVGDYMTHCAQISDHNAPFDLEMILAADPDVLIVNSAMGAHKYAMEVEPQLREAGIPVVLIEVPGTSISTSPQSTMSLLGQIFQAESRAQELNEFLDAQYKLLEDMNLSSREDKPTVYYEKSGYSEIFGATSSSQAGWGTIIALAGGENIADPLLLETAAEKGGGSSIDPEYVLQADPDFVILTGAGGGWMDKYPGGTPADPAFDIVNRTGWSELTAVKNCNVYELAHTMNRSLTAFYACQKLAEIFYPDAFADIDVEANLDAFFERFMLVDSDITGWVFRMTEDAVK